MNPAEANFVQKTFSPKVSRTYELVNHVLTFGMDILWRKKAAETAASFGGKTWADVCTGTGETAAYLARLAPEGTSVKAVDFSEAMLEEARKKPEAEKISFLTADVKNLPFEDNCLDIITISFATRNINLNKETLITTFKEFNRVLKPGGRFINLETSQPKSQILRKLYHLYIKIFVRPIGGIISGSYTGYAYLSHTIPRFYPPEELADVMKSAGFKEVSFTNLFSGIAALHVAEKA